jgi:DNA invertase Pin-like site-specific DNA recombinase
LHVKQAAKGVKRAPAAKARAATKAPAPGAAKRGRGRPRAEETKPEAYLAFLEGVKLGLSLRSSCYAAGLSVQTVRDRIRRARAGEDREFLAQIRHAFAAGERELIERIHAASRDPQQWRAGLALLAIRNPRRYTPAGRIEARAAASADGVVEITVNVPRPGLGLADEAP